MDRELVDKIDARARELGEEVFRHQKSLQTPIESLQTPIEISGRRLAEERFADTQKVFRHPLKSANAATDLRLQAFPRLRRRCFLCSIEKQKFCFLRMPLREVGHPQPFRSFFVELPIPASFLPTCKPVA